MDDKEGRKAALYLTRTEVKWAGGRIRRWKGVKREEGHLRGRKQNEGAKRQLKRKKETNS